MLFSMASSTAFLAFFSPGPVEFIIFGIIAVLLFGSRLPSVARVGVLGGAASFTAYTLVVYAFTQAPIALVHAAGGVVTDWKGRPAHEGGRAIAAANPKIHAAALEIVEQSMLGQGDD